jgi:hypothetical protein
VSDQLHHLQDAYFVLDKSTFFKGAKRKRGSAGAPAMVGCTGKLHAVSNAHCPHDLHEFDRHPVVTTAGDAGPPPASQRPDSAGARPPAAVAAARGNEGVLADDDQDDANVFGQFQYLP